MITSILGEAMGERLAKFWSGPIIDRVLALLGVIGLAGLMGLMSQIVKMATDYPLPLAFVSGGSFLIGVLFAYLLGWREAKIKRYEDEQKELAAQKLEEAKRIKAEKRAESDRCYEFRTTGYWAKLVLYRMYRSHAPFELERAGNGEVQALIADLEYSSFTTSEETADGVRFEMTKSGREFLDSHQDLLAYISSEWEKGNHEEEGY